MSFSKTYFSMDGDTPPTSEFYDLFDSPPPAVRRGRRSPIHPTSPLPLHHWLSSPSSSEASCNTSPRPASPSSAATSAPHPEPQMIVMYGKNDVQITLLINNCKFTYDNSGFRRLGYIWAVNPLATSDRTLNYWRAHMAFHAVPTAGLDIDGMRTVLSKIDISSMDEGVRRGKQRMFAQYSLWQERFLQEDMVKRNPIKYPRFARTETANFLGSMFLDDDGIDVGGEPVLLTHFFHPEMMDDVGRADFSLACKKWDLYCRATKQGHVIVGSAENDLGAALAQQVEATLVAGFSKRDPEYDIEEWEYDDELEVVPKKQKVAKPIWRGLDSFSDEDESEAEEEKEQEETALNGDWEITGTWAITFPNNDKIVAPQRQPTPNILEIFSTCTKTSRETYGRFSFSRFHGFFRFVSHEEGEDGGAEIEMGDGSARKVTRRSKFDLDISDVPSEKNPSRTYHWRGKRTSKTKRGERAFRDLFTRPGDGKMQFSNGGKKLTGTWENRAVGFDMVRFEGVRECSGKEAQDERLGKGGCNIHYEWRVEAQAAYYTGNNPGWKSSKKAQ